MVIEINTKSNNLIPGFGFNYLNQSSTNTSIDKKIEQLKIDQNIFKPSYIPSLIRSGTDHLQNDCFCFQKQNTGQVQIRKLNNYSEVVEFAGESRTYLLKTHMSNMKENLVSKDSILNNLNFDDSTISFFIKATAESGKLSLNNGLNCDNCAKIDEFDFRSRFGDSFIKNVTLGSSIFLQLSFPKNLDEKSESLQADISEAFQIDNQKRSIDEFPLLKRAKLTLLDSSQPNLILSGVSESMRYIKLLPKMATTTPTVISASIDFYDRRTISEDYLSGLKETILNFEQKIVPNGFDLCQCLEYLKSESKNSLHSEKFNNFDENFARKMSKINHSLNKLSTFIEELGTSCWSPDLPQIENASSIMEMDDNLFSPHNSANVSIDLPSKNEIPLEKPLLHTPHEIEFSSLYHLSITLFDKLQKLMVSDVIEDDESDQDENPSEKLLKEQEIPKYLILPCNDLSEEPHYTTHQKDGNYCSVLYDPKSQIEVLKLMTENNIVHSDQIAIFPYLKVYKCTNSSNLTIKSAIYNNISQPNAFKRLRPVHKNCSIGKLPDNTFEVYITNKHDVDSILTDIVNELEAIFLNKNVDAVAKEQILEDIRSIQKKFKVIEEAQISLKDEQFKMRQNLSYLKFGPRFFDETISRDAILREQFYEMLLNSIEINIAESENVLKILKDYSEIKKVEEDIDNALNLCTSLSMNVIKNLQNISYIVKERKTIKKIAKKIKQVEFYILGMKNDAVEAELSLYKIYQVKYNHKSKMSANLTI